jgi:hypothetical protein
MSSTPVRIPDTTTTEIQATARLFGVTPGELIERAWAAYRATPQFRDDFQWFQKAVSVGDVNAIATRLEERRHQAAASKAAKIRAK